MTFPTYRCSLKRLAVVVCLLTLSITSPASADTKKGRGSVNNPMTVGWRGEGPTQITVRVQQSKPALLIVLGASTGDLIWCASITHSTRDRVLRCEFNAASDSYGLAVGALSGSASFEVTVTSNPLGESRAVPSGLEDQARSALQRFAKTVRGRAAG